MVEPLCPYCFKDNCPWLVAWEEYMARDTTIPVPSGRCPHASQGTFARLVLALRAATARPKVQSRLDAAKHLRSETGATLLVAMEALDATTTLPEAFAYVRNRGNA
jgi:hypothetical protein